MQCNSETKSIEFSRVKGVKKGLFNAKVELKDFEGSFKHLVLTACYKNTQNVSKGNERKERKNPPRFGESARLWGDWSRPNTVERRECHVASPWGWTPFPPTRTLHVPAKQTVSVKMLLMTRIKTRSRMNTSFESSIPLLKWPEATSVKSNFPSACSWRRMRRRVCSDWTVAAESLLASLEIGPGPPNASQKGGQKSFFNT